MSHSAKPHRNVIPVMPKVVCDAKHQHYFSVGEFLGKGGFGACYRLTDKSGAHYAAKVVGKHLLKTKSHTEKVCFIFVRIYNIQITYYFFIVGTRNKCTSGNET